MVRNGLLRTETNGARFATRLLQEFGMTSSPNQCEGSENLGFPLTDFPVIQTPAPSYTFMLAQCDGSIAG